MSADKSESIDSFVLAPNIPDDLAHDALQPSEPQTASSDTPDASDTGIKGIEAQQQTENKPDVSLELKKEPEAIIVSDAAEAEPQQTQPTLTVSGPPDAAELTLQELPNNTQTTENDRGAGGEIAADNLGLEGTGSVASDTSGNEQPAAPLIVISANGPQPDELVQVEEETAVLDSTITNEGVVSEIARDPSFLGAVLVDDEGQLLHEHQRPQSSMFAD
jgi:hypothetical protein